MMTCFVIIREKHFAISVNANLLFCSLLFYKAKANNLLREAWKYRFIRSTFGL